MKLFIWKRGVLTGYRDGIAVAVADNVEDARKLILDKYYKEEIESEYYPGMTADEVEDHWTTEWWENMQKAIARDPYEIKTLPACTWCHGGE